MSPAAHGKSVDVESLERATLAAVPPRRLREMQGWLLGFDEGTVGRCHSAAPLSHSPTHPRPLQEIAEAYREEGLRPVLRLPRIEAFESWTAQLAAQGLRRAKPTCVQAAACADVARTGEREVKLDREPGDAWTALFLGDGFDPVDAASRLGILRRSRDSLFASVEVDGQVAAVGCACYGHGWLGIHGMRTAPAFRARGCASAILAAMAREAQRRGIHRAFLQVEEGNTRAQSLYRRAGFETAWVYEYWMA